MKTLKIIAYATMMVALITSCNNDEDPMSSSNKMVNITLSAMGDELQEDQTDDATRIGIIDGLVQWYKGSDKISVFSHKNPGVNYEFSMKYPSDDYAASCSFTGWIKDEDVSDNGVYYGIYPYSASNRVELDGTTPVFYFNIPSEQIAEADNLKYNPSVAISNANGNFYQSNGFKHPCALLRIKFTGSSERIKEIEKLTFKCFNGSGTSQVNVIGNMKKTGTSGTLSFADEESKGAVINFHRPENGNFEYDKSYYVSLYPTYVYGLRLYINDGTTNLIKGGSQFKFQAGKIITLTIPVNNE